MLSLRGRHVDKEQTLGHMEQYFVIVEPKKVSQVLEKKVFSLHGLHFGLTQLLRDLSPPHPRGGSRGRVQGVRTPP